MASFAGPTCQLQYTSLPQGYRNSVSEYSRFTSYILGGLMWQCCLTYLDDFLVWSPTFDQHLIDIDKVLTKTEHFGVQFSAKKTLFCRKRLPYLGHVIEAGKGISPNPKKVQSINDMREPTTKRELGTFLQSLSFYRRMIPLFNRTADPLRKKFNDKKFKEFTEEERNSFQQLKQALTQAPVLAIPDLSPNENPFYIITDASKEGLGGILLQKGTDGTIHPISYISRMTETKERERYTTYQLEMAAIIWSIQVFKPYLRYKSIPFTLRTDCKSLCWLLTAEHDTQIKKWIFNLTEFDFKIEHLRGSDNPSDVLSRLPLPVPQGYFQEEPLEPLYSNDHTEMMKFIIGCLEVRAQTKTQLSKQKPTSSPTKSKKFKQTNTIEQTNTPLTDNELRELLKQDFTTVHEQQQQRTRTVGYNAELHCVLTPTRTTERLTEQSERCTSLLHAMSSTQPIRGSKRIAMTQEPVQQSSQDTDEEMADDELTAATPPLRRDINAPIPENVDQANDTDLSDNNANDNNDDTDTDERFIVHETQEYKENATDPDETNIDMPEETRVPTH